MAHLYYTRHGQTIWNVENKICGASDIALTELGHEQSDEKTYLPVAHKGISRVVHSYFNDMTNDEFARFGIRNCEIRRYEFS